MPLKMGVREGCWFIMETDRYRLAGLASAKARRERLGEDGFRRAMQELGQKGGRPPWQQLLAKSPNREQTRQSGER